MAARSKKNISTTVEKLVRGCFLMQEGWLYDKSGQKSQQ